MRRATLLSTFKAQHRLRPWPILALALVIQVNAALAQDSVPPTRAALVDAAAGLPSSVQLLPLSTEDLKQLGEAYEPRGCGGWVFAAAASNSDEPGPPLIALPREKYGAFRVRAGLGPVSAVSAQRADERHPSLRVKRTGFSLGPWVEIAGWQDAQVLLIDRAGWRAGPILGVRAIDGSVAQRRVPCTLGGGMCRRYAGTYRGQWVTVDDKDHRPLDLPVEVSPARLIVEDRCPWTRTALIEYYASRIGLQEWYYRMTNP